MKIYRDSKYSDTAASKNNDTFQQKTYNIAKQLSQQLILTDMVNIQETITKPSSSSLTLAVGAKPSPVISLRAKALAIHDVMVSGTVAVSCTLPSFLYHKALHLLLMTTNNCFLPLEAHATHGSTRNVANGINIPS